ncbi:MAG: PASTA domain-containing protein [Solirubrobacterales bacterium]
MSNAVAAPSQSGQRAKRGGAGGRQLVGEYVGEPAGQAAQAVRRAGLRPGLDRSFGCETELVGRVVAQDPPAGSELARNGLVTLYVAAPGADPDDAIDRPPAALERTPPEADVEQPEPRTRRRRKRGRAGDERRTFPPPPAPAPPPGRPRGPVDAAGAAIEITEDLRAPARAGVGVAAEVEAPAEGALGDEEARDEQFVIYADDVFAGRAEPAWRRVYPRGRGSSAGGEGLRSWFGGRSRLLKAALALLVAWIVVALASALAGSSTSRHRASAVARPAARVPDHASPRGLVRASRPNRAPARGKAQALERRARVVTRRRSRSAAASGSGAGPERASARPPRPSQAAAQPPTPASAPTAPAPEQTRGGLFSP